MLSGLVGVGIPVSIIDTHNVSSIMRVDVFEFSTVFNYFKMTYARAYFNQLLVFD